MAQIYISSTYSDLKEHRDVVYRTLRQMRHDVIAMEDYVASDQRPLAKCLADVSTCDIYVLIIAWRYGFVPAKDNPEKKSITEMEFREAVQKDKPCLIFLLAEDYPWSPLKMEKGEGAERLQALRGELGENYTVSFFRNEEDLARLVSTAVYQCNPAPPESKPRPAPAHMAEPDLGPIVSKTCNRTGQEATFMNFFRMNMKATRRLPQILFVHGEERECHDSFVERLTETKIKTYAEKIWGEQKGVVTFKSIDWTYDGHVTELQHELQQMLFAEFDPVYMGEELSATALSQLDSISRTPLVVIQHRIHAARWNRATRELLVWYMAYWAGMKINPSRPQFLIFLSIIYPKSQPSNWWKRWKASAQPDKDRIALELQEISQSHTAGCPCLLLKELLPVRPEDVKDWLSKHKIHSEKDRDELVEKIFKTGDGRLADFRSMADVEDELQRLVNSLSRSVANARGKL
ncbi:MAG: hypothetical protein V7641_2512 [Blastocatellia bacterium]